MIDLQRLILGCKVVLNIALYPIWMIGFIAEIFECPPYHNGKIDNPMILGWSGFTLLGLLIWLTVLLLLM